MKHPQLSKARSLQHPRAKNSKGWNSGQNPESTIPIALGEAPWQAFCRETATANLGPMAGKPQGKNMLTYFSSCSSFSFHWLSLAEPRMKGHCWGCTSGGQPHGERARWRGVQGRSERAIRECPVQVYSIEFFKVILNFMWNTKGSKQQRTVLENNKCIMIFFSISFNFCLPDNKIVL